MTSKVAERICKAIVDLRVLKFDYQGQPRVVKPYCYGVSPKNNELLRAIQVRGSSTSSGFGFGKLWTVSQMACVQVGKETFTPDDPDYNPDDSAMARIFCRVTRKNTRNKKK